MSSCTHWASLVAQMAKNLPRAWETQVRFLGQEDPWRREWLPTPVFLPGEFYRQRNLEGYNPWGCRKLDKTEQLTYMHTLLLEQYPTHRHKHTHTHTHTHTLSKLSWVDSWVIQCTWNSDVPGQVPKVPSAVLLAVQILSLQLPSSVCFKVPVNRSQIYSLQTTPTKLGLKGIFLRPFISFPQLKGESERHLTRPLRPQVICALPTNLASAPRMVSLILSSSHASFQLLK